MKVDSKKLDKGQVELTIELTPEEYQPFLEIAAKNISESTKIDGFRPGKAGYELIEKKVGKNEVWQQAIEPAMMKTLVKALEQEDLKTVGQPHVDVVKLAPDNNVIYKAKIDLLPEVKLGDLSGITIKRNEVKADDAKVKKALEDLQKMNSKETEVDRAAKEGDKVDINFETFMDKVPIDQGEQKNFPLTLGEKTFIPGFEEQLIGLKKGEEKEFKLEFPKEYHQKNLAGREADFKVKMNTVFELELAELNDDLAKTLGGFESIKAVEEEIQKNIEMEANKKEDQRVEEEMIMKIIDASTYDDIPDLLITAEARKMIEELEHNVSHQGIKFEDYLMQIKKDRGELLLEFTPQAIKRVQSALALRKIGEEEKLTVTPEEVEEEVKKTLLAYGNNPDAEKQINTPQYKNHLHNMLVSQKIVDHLKAKMVK